MSTPAPKTAPPAAAGKSDTPPSQGWGRELLETISFVVILVLLLKAVVAEAFVIPTGSMATTLFGEHFQVKCPSCGFRFTINNSPDPEAGTQEPPDRCQCPNCLEIYSLRGDMPGASFLPANAIEMVAGDKVLVLKPPYDYGKPQRFDVIVFKYPGNPLYLMTADDLKHSPYHYMQPFRAEGLRRAGGPQENYIARNFIKRLWGLPGEKLAIKQGKVFLCVKDQNGNEQLQLLRKPPHVLLQIRRLVHDNDFLHKEVGTHWQTFSKENPDPLADVTPDPWQFVEGKPEDKGKAFASTGTSHFQWLRYQHRREPKNPDPHLITNAMDYNQDFSPRPMDSKQSQCWVGDLMVEAAVEVQEAKGELVFELPAGTDVARAVCDLATGKVTLQILRVQLAVKAGQNEVQVKEVAKWEKETPLFQTGKHQVRFSNCDKRLTLWVDGKNLCLTPCDYDAVSDNDYGPRYADLYPVGLGAREAKVKVSGLKVWRDTYYTKGRRLVNGAMESGQDYNPHVQLTLPVKSIREQIGQQVGDVSKEAAALLPRALIAAHQLPLARQPLTDPPCFYPVPHPEYHKEDHFSGEEYFALGDNSVHSQDSRYWGQIPERLLVGRAVLVYWPFGHWKIIR